MQNLLEGLGRFPEQLSYAGDYYSFLDMKDEADGKTGYPGLRDSITLKNVSFKYPNSDGYAVKSLSLAIAKGEKIVVLGENGSGKTTLTKLILGLYAPESGRVMYDGYDVKSLAKDDFLAGASAIAQDFVPYSLSLRENVAISDVSRMGDDAAILAALDTAGAAADRGLDDMMGREFGGAELSGGQWQKPAIARGLFRNSGLIVLDEPTSALDPLMETEVLTRFINGAKGKTALIISHRVGLCKIADRIIVMKNGEIVQDGTHDGLMAAGGEYFKLYTAQAKWYESAARPGG